MARWVALLVGASLVASGALFSFARANAPASGNLTQLRDDLRELNNKLARVIKQLEADDLAVLDDPGHWERTLTDLENVKLSAVGQFPGVFGLPYSETFTKLSCIDDEIAVGKQLVHLAQGPYLTTRGKGYTARRVLFALKNAKDCKDLLETEVPGTTTTTTGSITTTSATTKSSTTTTTKTGTTETTTTETTTTTTGPAYQCVGSEMQLYNNWNTGAVDNGGAAPSFSTDGNSYCVVSISTYHWNGGAGAAPGTIGLEGSGGELGPWQATGSGQNGDVNWTVTLSTSQPVVIDGTYSCQDSDPGTWSQNTTSGGYGFCKVYVETAQANG